MIDFTISKANADDIARNLLGGPTECCAIVFASRAVVSSDRVRLIAREIEFPTPGDYAKKGRVEAELLPAFVAKVSKKASQRGYSLVFVHSHPGTLAPQFSEIDDMGEELIAKFLAVRVPDVPHGSIVISSGGWRGRELGTKHSMSIVSIGEERRVLFDALHGNQLIPSTFDRQVRAFGAQGQRLLRSLKVGIVGLGGTGSIITEQLAYLGVTNFVLIDPDRIELTNLNRVVGATPKDVGRLKVEVGANHVKAISPDASVRCVTGDVTHVRVAKELFGADFIFSCTDSHGSRAIIQQVSYQYLVPCIDVGSIITASEERVTGIFGRVQALAPGLACFSCSDLINPEEVRRDMMSEDERKLDPYIEGAREPAPAVISINGTVSSLAISMFMAMAIGIPSNGRYLLYNGKGPTLRPVSASPKPNCYICSTDGALARGDALQLFGRMD